MCEKVRYRYHVRKYESRHKVGEFLAELWHRVFNSISSSPACTAQIAIASFWSLLQDLADLGTAPDGWSTVPQNHPFLGYKFPGLILNLPVELALPPTL